MSLEIKRFVTAESGALASSILLANLISPAERKMRERKIRSLRFVLVFSFPSFSFPQSLAGSSPTAVVLAGRAYQ
jgi:hypothetical protein